MPDLPLGGGDSNSLAWQGQALELLERGLQRRRSRDGPRTRVQSLTCPGPPSYIAAFVSAVSAKAGD
jgi:hypothetical protein